MVETLLVESSNKGKWEAMANEGGVAWKLKEEKASKTGANCGGRWCGRLNHAPCPKMSTLYL